MISKSDQITALALEILEDAELSRTSVVALVMKASRLARLTDDEEPILWLDYERFGYNDSDELSEEAILWLDYERFGALFHFASPHATGMMREG